MFLCVLLRFHCIRLLKLYACKGFRKRSYEPGSPSLFSILLFYSTVCFHFAEQINDDDDDDDDDQTVHSSAHSTCHCEYLFVTTMW